MTATPGRYVAIETGIAIVANVVLADLAAMIVFHGRDPIPVGGPAGLAADMVVQTFAIAFMTVLIATALTRRRRREGKLPAIPDAPPPGPRVATLRALIVAVGLAAVAAPLSVATLSAGPATWSIPAMLALKTIYAALLAAAIAPPALRAALRDPVVAIA